MFSRSISDRTLLWVTDADNTLWDTDAIYRRAQENLLTGVEDALGIRTDARDRLTYVRDTDEELARRDHRGFRYPPPKLVEAIAWRLRGETVEASASRALTSSVAITDALRREIVDRFQENLQVQPSLRRGVREGLLDLRRGGSKVVVITEGDRERIERTITWHDLGSLFESLIYAQKSEPLFSRIRKASAGIAAWSIGDQIEKDVLPAKAAGFVGILFPSAFRPKWAAPGGLYGDVPIVESYDSAVRLALKTID